MNGSRVRWSTNGLSTNSDQPDIHPIKWSMVFTRKENNINVKKKVYYEYEKIMDSFYRFIYATVG